MSVVSKAENKRRKQFASAERKHHFNMKRAKQYGQTYTDITPSWLFALWQKSKHCRLCGRKMVDGRHAPDHPRMKTLDHRKPLGEGGKHMKDNIDIICLTCHRKKDEAKPGGE